MNEEKIAYQISRVIRVVREDPEQRVGLQKQSDQDNKNTTEQAIPYKANYLNRKPSKNYIRREESLGKEAQGEKDIVSLEINMMEWLIYQSFELNQESWKNKVVAVRRIKSWKRCAADQEPAK